MSQHPHDQDGPAAEAPLPEGPGGQAAAGGAGPEVAGPEVDGPEVDGPTSPPVADPEPGAPERDVTVELVRELDERTADLQRLQAEYVNYKRRVDRDRDAVRETARATVLAGLLSVLDDLDRAREHGELTGGFKAVADSLERTLVGLGLERFGEAGEPFDPQVHEALMHGHDDDVDGPTARTILQPGYRVGERVLRPARVAVVEPSPDGPRPEREGGPADGTDGAEGPDLPDGDAGSPVN